MDIITKITDLCTYYLTSFGPLLGFFLIILESIFPPLPLGVFVALNCNAFGLLFGIVLSWLATIIGCTLSFWLFDRLSKRFIYKHTSTKMKQRIIRGAKKFNKIKFSSLVLLIALPFAPAFLINVIAGVSNLPKRKYIAALLIGKISTISFWGIIGKSFIESMHDYKAITFILITTLIAYIMSRIVSKKMNIE